MRSSKRQMRVSASLIGWTTAMVVHSARPATAQSPLSGDRISIGRTTGKITIDGDLSDEGWRGATRVDKWYETNPGDNEGGYTFRPTGVVSRLRTFLQFDHQTERNGALIRRLASPGFGMDTKLNGFMRFRYAHDEVRSGDSTFPRQRFVYVVQVSPSRRVSQIALDGSVGQEVDFANARPGRGATVNVGATLHPTDHLELALVENQRWLSVDDPRGISRRLFTARVSRIRGTYTFTARSFARLIAQYVATDRDPSLYVSSVSAASSTFSGSALFAYKLNWQSVLFLGYGDDRELSSLNRLEKTERQFFVKVSYAFQR